MSKETKKKKESQQPETNTQTADEFVEEQLDELTELKKQLEETQAQLAQVKNDYLKAYADTENTKKRLQQDFESRIKYRIQSFALDILPVIDNLERALNDQQQDFALWRKGIEMIAAQLIEALKKEGINEVDALHQVFNPNLHQALTTEVSEMDENMILEVFQKGYLLKDRLLRPSLVKVSEGKGKHHE